MTQNQKVLGGAVTLLLLLFTVKRAKAATGTVDIGAPSVTGPGAGGFGGADYGVEPAETEMQRLIRISNEAIAQDDLVNPR